MKAYPWLTAALILAASSTAGAQKGGKGKGASKPKAKACGIVAIPMAVGNQWVYEPVLYPWPRDAQGIEIVVPPEQLKQMPAQPKKVTITVTDVQATKDNATVTLSEDVDGRVLTTTITCTQSEITISPESFWFAGEPGFGWNLALSDLTRKGSSFPIGQGGMISKNEWHDDVKATWKRNATEGTEADLGSGKIELERHYVVTADESVAVTYNNFSGVHKIGLETHGRITVDGSEGKPTELPGGLVTWLWISDGTGPIKVANSFFHAYQLTGATLAK